jgi:hypothetical protein
MIMINYLSWTNLIKTLLIKIVKMKIEIKINIFLEIVMIFKRLLFWTKITIIVMALLNAKPVSMYVSILTLILRIHVKLIWI